MGKSVSTPMANTTQSMTRCDNLQARCPARPVSDRACSISSGEITLLSPASRSTTVSASGLGSKQLPCRVIVIASLKPGSYTHPRLQETVTCAKTNGIGAKPFEGWYVQSKSQPRYVQLPASAPPYESGATTDCRYPRLPRRQDRPEPPDERDAGGDGSGDLQVVVRGLGPRPGQDGRPSAGRDGCRNCRAIPGLVRGLSSRQDSQAVANVRLGRPHLS